MSTASDRATSALSPTPTVAATPAKVRVESQGRAGENGAAESSRSRRWAAKAASPLATRTRVGPGPALVSAVGGGPRAAELVEWRGTT